MRASATPVCVRDRVCAARPEREGGFFPGAGESRLFFLFREFFSAFSLPLCSFPMFLPRSLFSVSSPSAFQLLFPPLSASLCSVCSLILSFSPFLPVPRRFFDSPLSPGRLPRRSTIVSSLCLLLYVFILLFPFSSTICRFDFTRLSSGKRIEGGRKNGRSIGRKGRQGNRPGTKRVAGWLAPNEFAGRVSSTYPRVASDRVSEWRVCIGTLT